MKALTENPRHHDIRLEINQVLSALLETKPADHEVGLKEISRSTSCGPISIGRTKESQWCVLMPSNDDVRVPSQDLKNLKISRQVYELSNGPSTVLEVRLLQGDLLTQFVDLIVEILRHVENDPASPERNIEQAVRNWNEMLARNRRLTTADEVGLFGELMVLRELVRQDPQQRSASWQSGSGVHDFVVNGHRLEAKTTSSPDSFVVHIYDLIQLADPPEDDLHLAHVRIIPDEDGETLTDVISRLETIVCDPEALRETLKNRGWVESTTENQYRLVALEVYAVDEGFPRLTPASVNHPGGVKSIEYSIDLNSAVNKKLDTKRQEEFLAMFAQGNIS